MSVFKGLLKASLGVALLPVDAVRDTVSAMNPDGDVHKGKSKVKRRVQKLEDDLDETFDDDLF